MSVQSPPTRARSRLTLGHGVLALTALAAALRFSTLGVQSYWLDESSTAFLMQMPFGDMWSTIPHTESTPPLYYAIAWLWAQPFGAGEVALRSLSALFGTLTIPVAYAAVARLASPRAGLVVGALAAVNPLLIWYSQEARAYALLVLLATASLYLFARALERPTARVLAAWALVSAAALATHYFAAFVLVPEAVWLLARRRRMRELLAVGAVAAVGGALLPLAIDQANNRGAAFIGRISLLKRMAQVPKQYLVGFDAPLEAAVTAVSLALAAFALWLLVARADEAERRGALRAGAIAVPAILVPLVLAIAGADYFITRNVIAAWVPSATVLASGLAARRARRSGAAATALLCAVSLAVTIGVDTNAAYQRGDWRGVSKALGPFRAPRTLVVSPVGGGTPLNFYMKTLYPYPVVGYSVTEVDAVAVAERRQGQTPSPPRPARVKPPPPGFTFAGEVRRPTFTIVRYRAPAPTPVSPPALGQLKLSGGLADLTVQLPPGPLRGPLAPPAGAYGG